MEDRDWDFLYRNTITLSCASFLHSFSDDPLILVVKHLLGDNNMLTKCVFCALISSVGAGERDGLTRFGFERGRRRKKRKRENKKKKEK
ncbi:hypothetical protein SLEP1_g31583 [Rubroshorea leprosula]|uniref:Uncharacterized protein n=1 Tax=Rubroshorea leprosula TaxID=152421 RepID=A0AAV5KAL1_9ROSI|nr:hypothetical protein SLEP1_g31583 [Rubroshorea leprosula]